LQKFAPLISLPIRNIFVFIATKIVKGEKEKNNKKQWRKAFKYINKRFLKVPIIAEEQIKKEIKIIIDLSKKNLDINISELLEQNNKYNAEINVTKDLINYLNFESAKFLVKIKKSIKEKIDDEINNNFLLLNHLIKINKYINGIFEINIIMKNKEIKFNENEIKNINNLKELINKLFDFVVKNVEDIPENKNGQYFLLTEKIRKTLNSLFQKNYISTITGQISVCLGFNFIFILSDFEKICSNLEKMV
jgi:Na+/phosphate symporter